MNILVTGAAGFIGSHLTERLLADGHTVVGLDNLDPFYDMAIKRQNLSNFNQHENFTFVLGDICEPEDVERACTEQKPDMIVHLAAKAGVRPSILAPVPYHQVNVEGTTVMLEAARHYKIPKFIFASSSSVYGNNEKIPFAETDNVDYPISPYAATKKAGELICYTYSHLHDIDITCLRFFTAYGPRQRPDLAIHKFARLILDDKPIPVYGDGSMRRDYTYIDDIIDGVRAAMDRCSGYNIYNLGESQPIRLDELIAELENALGKKAIINRLPLQPGDVNQTYADVTKAKLELGYHPTTELSVGLKRFADWLKNTNTTE
ncbi:dTDP-glucose 4,6-dehydratase [Anaerohalosphaera lusitana]|uniref:dTDP-glucose 4,6-dehydratase n=1 Tax=Anaerohalosphaera lusitana TaxID=1936003 RepID=A0A1U9NQZ4_9BACT|nr:GDP-mannose 4,6-dehydratase [Anaerohalosphaera lusitana]AQT70341.1 dTDP-glucose 4,6-dehydratase [Anaerohalosphaera lusitana]